MPKVFLNGVTLHYQRLIGDGPELVLLHGFATNLAFWYFRIAPLLARDFCLTLYDLRGHGQSDMPPSGYTTADMAADLHELLEHLQVSRAHLVGHSYGGAVALHYTVLHPERVASLTLADTRIRALQPVQRLTDMPNTKAWERRLKELQVPVSFDDLQMDYQFLEILAEVKVQGREVRSTGVDLFSPFELSKQSSRTAGRWLQLLRTTTARNEFRRFLKKNILNSGGWCWVDQNVVLGQCRMALQSFFNRLHRRLPERNALLVDFVADLDDRM
jgi:pimeloyl-ACP methyl ester carboxylesterase